MSDSLFGNLYNPDVLSCLANLSSDEVFTPPEIVNNMLDLLPRELFQSPDTKFLDPACKSGVFLREIAKRLIDGLADVIPDRKARIDHIFHHQLYGIAITELTSLLSRRGVYCSKYPNSRYSVTHFDSAEGNIRFKRVDHTFKNDRCVFCGASAGEYDREDGLETHAYELIHTKNPEEIFNMKFDVIIGNPPYQLSFGFGGGNKAKAMAIYNKFISQSIKLHPRYLIMITPSRWMTKTADSIPVAWVDEMIMCNHFKVMHDFSDASFCFPGVEIKGGVNYFLYQPDYAGTCEYYYHDNTNNSIDKRNDYLDALKAGVVIRDPKAYKIIKKICSVEDEYFLKEDGNFSYMVSPAHYYDDGITLTSNWRGFSVKKDHKHCIKYYTSKSVTGYNHAWIAKNDLIKNHQTLPLHKVIIPAAGGTGTDAQVLGHPIYSEPNSISSQTYRVIGYDPEKHNFTKEECENIISYIKTRFFRYLVSIKKKTQNGPRGVYQFVPLQDFSKPWTDEELYKKYNLTQEEIGFIESMIKPMDEEEK